MLIRIKMALGQFHAGCVGIATSPQTHSHKREIGSMGHFHKQRIGIADIAGGKRDWLLRIAKDQYSRLHFPY